LSLRAASRILRDLPQIRAIRDHFGSLADAPPQRVSLVSLPPAARAPLMAALLDGQTDTALIVTSRSDRADSIALSLSEYLPSGRPVRVWPAPEAMPFEQLPFDSGLGAERVALLSQLNAGGPDAPAALVVTVRGLVQIVMAASELKRQTLVIRAGRRLRIDDVVTWATTVGYTVVPLVNEPGTLARRGGIIDIFVPGTAFPVRLDFFGDEVDSLRAFDPHTQRSQEKLDQAILLPPTELPLWRAERALPALRSLDDSKLRDEIRTEWRRMIERVEHGQIPASVDLLAPYLVPERSTIIDYFPRNALVLIEEPQAIDLAATSMVTHAGEVQVSALSNGELPPGLEQPFADWAAVDAALGRHHRIALGSAAGFAEIDVPALDDAPLFAGRVDAMVDAIDHRRSQGWSVYLASDQAERLGEILAGRSIPWRAVDRDEDGDRDPSSIAVVHSDLPVGWELDAGDDRVVVLTDFEIFGFHKATRRSYRRSTSDAGSNAADFTPGEFVVHIDHGIAEFTGLVRMETSGVEREYMLLVYAKGDKLYVPVDQSDRVSRYTGGGIEPVASRLGSGEWVRTKQRVRKAIREMAWELIQLYAERETSEGTTYGPDAPWDRELEESFPFEETVDQQKAIDDVKSDMESPRPMDRLVCGDVGFGKTEVALRAAFKAVNGGKQVAVLVPTTVLALQHFETFTRRLSSYPVRIEMLSRLRDKAQQREILKGLKAGTVDIVIGTHRVVQGDVQFKDLGLVIVDEEQRFGVRQKEFLKRFRTAVDVISMSATPIPRTLHMSLAGIRDISVIDTAPQARLPVRTFVTAWSDHLVREVILRELDRGGQVYFIHNRVHDIDRLAHRLRELVPEARIGIGHGQMDESVLEDVILSFVRHDFDVLLSTTIIESGIDIPNTNTIVIDNADTLGLTQLYQLRGRVGRSTQRAYAYLLYREGKALSEIAQERLEAIQEATELGAGLRVAMRDMEIRGAGNILGAEQSGHIGSIGFDLYIRLLGQAVDEITSGQPSSDPNAVLLDLPLTALIPASYIVDTELRLATYRRIASVTSPQGLEDMRTELVDRFGEVPDEVEHLLALIAVRLRCEALGIESVVEREREMVIRPVRTAGLDGKALTRKLGPAVRLTPNSIRVRLVDLRIPWQEALDVILDAVAASMPDISGPDTATGGTGLPRSRVLAGDAERVVSAMRRG
jgi:transcription-repair coupling factor (superfamily II helicase)